MMQSNPGNSRPATLMGVLGRFVAALLYWLSVRLARLTALAIREARGIDTGAIGAGSMPPREPMSGSARQSADYSGCAKATDWSACAGLWGRVGALVGGATDGRIETVVTDSPARTPSDGGI